MLGLKICRVLSEKGFNTRSDRFDISSVSETVRISKELLNIDFIIHCAAMTNVDECEENKEICYATNCIGTKNIVNLAEQWNAGLIYISTPMVFSGTSGDYKEESVPSPQNYYAETKLCGEREVLKYEKGLVIRANPIGVRTEGSHPSFIQWFVNAAKNNSSFDLFTDVRINPISTDSLAGILGDLLNSFQSGILHLGSRDIANKADIWRLVVSYFPDFSGSVRELSVDETLSGRIAKRPKEMWLNVGKAMSLGLELPFWRIEVESVMKELLQNEHSTN